MSDTGQPFEHPMEHLLAELAWIRTTVREHLALAGRLGPEDATRGDRVGSFAVTAAEAERLLEAPEDRPRPPGEAALVRRLVDERVGATVARGEVTLPLVELRRAFALDVLGSQLLTLALGAELDEGIRRIYMYAWNDFTRRAPTVEFLLGLLQPSTTGRLLNAEGLFATSPLVRGALVRVGEGDEPYMARSVRVAPSVAAFVAGGSELDPSLARSARLVLDPPHPDLLFDRSVREPIDRTLARVGTPGAPVVVLVGAAGTGKSSLAYEHLVFPGRPALEVHAESVLRPVEGASGRIAALRRDARMLGAPLLIDLADADQEDPALADGYRQLAEVAAGHPHGAVVTARDAASWFVSLLDQAAVAHLPLPTKEQRLTLWRRGLAVEAVADVGDEVLEAAARYPLSGGAIARASLAAVAAAQAGGGRRGGRPRVEDVVTACRAQLTPRLSGIATRIVTTFTWDDLIIPEESAERLHEIVAYARHKTQVFDTWGYGRLLPYGRGLSVLFSGPPGTGKTMASGIVAGELGMEVFRIDLSRTVSKYIGETEKNLGRIFDEAAKSQSILLFDEADSLFAKRTSVKSSVDRYANLEVNYLLQRMEDFEGVTILTTNFEGSIDEAFRRRIRFRVHFPAPDLATRARLWERVVTPEARGDQPLDFELLAEDYELSGGHIKNAALRAAFFAADGGRRVRMRDLHKAARLESHKLGKLVRTYDDDDEAEAEPGSSGGGRES